MDMAWLSRGVSLGFVYWTCDNDASTGLHYNLHFDGDRWLLNETQTIDESVTFESIQVNIASC